MTVSLYPFYHFNRLYRRLDISWVIAAENFTLSTLALVAALVARVLKSRVALGNISRVLLNPTDLERLGRQPL